MKIEMEERDGVLVATVTRRFLWWTWTRVWVDTWRSMPWSSDDGSYTGFDSQSLFLLPALQKAARAFRVRKELSALTQKERPQ